MDDDMHRLPTDEQREQLANVSTDLTALADARARVRIDAAERDPNAVGSALGQHRARAGLTEQELADWLGIDLATLAELAEEQQPMVAGPDGAILQEMGLEQLAEVYGADRVRFLEAFEWGDP